MYVQCPECLTIFTVDGETIAQANGSVGCGYCGTTFDALVSLTENLPAASSDNLTLHPTSPAPPVLLMKVVRSPAPQQGLFAPAEAEAETRADADADDAVAEVELAPPDATAEPSFSRYRRNTPARQHGLRWALGCVLLVLCLGGQLAWSRRATLAANAHTGPWLRSACVWLHCTPPAVSDTSQLHLLSRDVRPHPTVANALLISLSMRNDARFRQPYPVVSITLSDLNDNRIAMRRFKPREYIRDAAVRATGLAPGATAAVVFEVHDPGKNAVAFQFGFQ